MKPHHFLICLALAAFTGCSTTNHPATLPLRYHNAQYDFSFYLPQSWQGYSVSTQQLDDEIYSRAEDKDIIVGHTPMITLRHPQWRSDAPYQDIPVLMFTRAQWDALHKGDLWPSAFAGGVMYELWHNQRFVFAISSRYNGLDDVNGQKEVSGIIASNCAVHTKPHLYDK